jgi:hypothetical protein
MHPRAETTAPYTSTCANMAEPTNGPVQRKAITVPSCEASRSAHRRPDDRPKPTQTCCQAVSFGYRILFLQKTPAASLPVLFNKALSCLWVTQRLAGRFLLDRRRRPNRSTLQAFPLQLHVRSGILGKR